MRSFGIFEMERKNRDLNSDVNVQDGENREIPKKNYVSIMDPKFIMENEA